MTAPRQPIIARPTTTGKIKLVFFPEDGFLEGFEDLMRLSIII